MAEAIERSPEDMSRLYAIEGAQLPLDKLAPLSATDLRPLVEIFAGSNRELGRQYARFIVYFCSGGNNATIAQIEQSSRA